MAPSAPSSFGGFHMELPSRSPGALGDGDSVLRTVGRTVERPWEPASDAAASAAAPFNLNAPRSPGDQPQPRQGFAEDTLDETLRLPAAPAPVRDQPTPSVVPPPLVRGGVVAVQAAEETSTRSSFLTGGAIGIVATLAIVAAVIGAVLLLRGGDSTENVVAKQELLFANARASAEKSDHAWAVAKCDQVINLDPTTRVAAAALVLRGKERLTLGDREGLEDLRSALRALTADDPLYAEAERAVAAAGNTK